MEFFSRITTIVGFIDLIRTFRPEDGRRRVYRGQSYTWNPLPALFRNPANLYASEHEIARELISIHPGEFSPDRTMFDRLVRMQHYGLPTRLLDVTSNPLVALYFSVQESIGDGLVTIFFVPERRRRYFDSDTVSCLANLANLSLDEKSQIQHVSPNKFRSLAAVKRLVQFIREEKPYFSNRIIKDDLFSSILVVPKRSNRRIVAQSGSFIVWGIPRSIDYVQNAPVTTLEYPIDSVSVHVDAAAKAKLRQDLEILGINEWSLFPEIDKAAKYIADKYRV